MAPKLRLLDRQPGSLRTLERACFASRHKLVEFHLLCCSRITEKHVMIHPIVASDVDELKHVIDRTGLFPSEMLDHMIAPYLAGNADQELWLTSIEGAPVAILYCVPERMTEGTWNMLLIAVDPAGQGLGIGGAIVGSAEAMLSERGARLLLVETSGLPEFEATRRFYSRRGFVEEARIPDFYQRGEDKVVFSKALS
jgi:GNAT superfamily N-acetyltransferase